MPMQKVTIAEAFETYRKWAMPPNPSPVQLDETRKAFYAGAIVVLEACKRIGEPDVPEMVGVQILDRMWHEGRDFALSHKMPPVKES